MLVSGSVGVSAGVAMGAMATTAEWGALSIGVLAGDAALGGAILAFSPVWGVALVFVVGVAVVGYATYQASGAANRGLGYVEEVWNSENGKKFRHEIRESIEQAWNFIKSFWNKGAQVALYQPGRGNHKSTYAA